VVDGHLAAYAANEDVAEVVAAVEPDARRRIRLGERLGLRDAACHADLGAMLARGGIDAIVVASPSARHFDDVALGVEHGVAVICEKPLCLTPVEAESLQATVARHAGFVTLMHNYLWQPGWIELERLSRERAVGEPVMLRVEELSEDHWTDGGGSGRWRRDHGGGPLFDSVYHAAYLAERLLASPIRDARSIEADLVHGYPSGDVALLDCVHQSGALSQLLAAWCFRGQPRAQAELFATEGALRYRYWAQPDRIEVDQRGRTGVHDVDRWSPAAASGYPAAFRDALTSVRDAGDPPVPLETGTRIVAALAAARRWDARASGA
jgi:predicted dehydrogenase